MALKQAVKHEKKLRLFIPGPAGSGKTYTALAIATELAKLSGGGPVALYDTEAGSASLYAGKFEFLTDQIEPPYTPEKFIAAILEAERAGCSVVILDSISHAWAGEGGLLDMVNQWTNASTSKNAFTAGWSKATPVQNRLLQTIMRAKLHVIATARTKTEWVMQKDDKGRDKPVKVGLAPVQRADTDYEFDVVLDMSAAHVGEVTKSRFESVADKVATKPGADFARMIWDELQGEPEEPGKQQISQPTEQQMATLNDLANEVYGAELWADESHRAKVAKYASGDTVGTIEALTGPEVQAIIEGLTKKKQAAAAEHRQPAKAKA